MCSFRWPLVHGTIRRWNWYRRLEDGRPTLQAMSGSPTSCFSSCPWHCRGGMRSHFKTRSPPACSLQSVVSYIWCLSAYRLCAGGPKKIIIIWWIIGTSTLSRVKWHPVESQGTTPSTTSFHVRLPQPKIPVTKEPSGLWVLVCWW